MDEIFLQLAGSTIPVYAVMPTLTDFAALHRKFRSLGLLICLFIASSWDQRSRFPLPLVSFMCFLLYSFRDFHFRKSCWSQDLIGYKVNN